MTLNFSHFHPPELHPKTIDVLSKLLKAVVTYVPSLIGCYVGYKVSSNVSLRYWIAAQHVSPPRTGHEVPKTKVHTLKIIFLTWFGGFLAYNVGYLGGPFAWWSILLLPITFLSFFSYLVGFYPAQIPFSVHRTRDGSPTLVAAPNSFWSRFFAVVSLYMTVYGLSGANGASFIFGGNQALSLIGFAGIIYHCCAGQASRKQSRLSGVLLRQYITPLPVVLMAFNFLLADPESVPQMLQAIKNLQDSLAANSIIRAIVLPFLGISTGQLLAMLLRFDYMIFSEKHPEVLEPNTLMFEAVPLSSLEVGKSHAVEDGVRLPTELPFVFSRKYYRTAFVTCLVTMISFVVAATFVLPAATEFAVMFAALYASLITTATATLLVAMCSGEFRKLWAYSELWKLAPVTTVPIYVQAVQAIDDRISEKNEVFPISV